MRSPLSKLDMEDRFLLGHFQLHSSVQRCESVILCDVVVVATYAILAVFERMLLLNFQTKPLLIAIHHQLNAMRQRHIKTSMCLIWVHDVLL